MAGYVDVATVSTFFQERILDVGNIQRGLGNDHLPIASTVSILLDDTDFVAGGVLCDHAAAESTTFAARFKLYVGLGDNSGVYTKLVGTFVCLELPKRDDGHVYLTLADDAMGKLSDLIVPPTPNDWWAGVVLGTLGGVPTGCFGSPAVAAQNPQPLFDWTIPTALQFGHGYGGCGFIGYPLCTFNATKTPADFDAAYFGAGRNPYIYPILVLATKSADAIGTDEAVGLTGVYRRDVIDDGDQRAGTTQGIPSSFIYGGVTYPVWKAYKTDPLAVIGPDGSTQSFSLLWIAFDVGAYSQFILGGAGGVTNGSPAGGIQNTLIPQAPEFPSTWTPQAAGGYPPRPPPAACNAMFAAFEYFEITGSPGSQVTGKATAARHGNPIDIIQDLVEQYSVMGASSTDSTRFTRARLHARQLVRGDIIPDDSPQQAGTQLGTVRTPYGIGTLRKALAEVASSSDVDVFCQMDGKIGVVNFGADFETQTSVYPTWSETRINNVRENIPSSGQRWTPYNRVFVQGGKRKGGPYDSATAIQSWKRIVSKVLQGKWWQNFQILPLFNPGTVSLEATSYVWAMRGLEAKVRPVIEFTTDIGFLAFDLGDYFLMSVTQGGTSSRYSAALWKLESVVIHPQKGSVEVTAVWMGDLQTDQPFLLDNESLVVRSKGVGGTLTCTTGSTTVLRSAGSFITDGLAAGDCILLRDSSEAATAFTRNRQIKVVSITDATHAVVADSAFGSAGAHVLIDADWTMQRSYLTYPTVVTDAANYPSGSTMYGKVSNSSGLFSDATQANKLGSG